MRIVFRRGFWGTLEEIWWQICAGNPGIRMRSWRVWGAVLNHMTPKFVMLWAQDVERSPFDIIGERFRHDEHIMDAFRYSVMMGHDLGGPGNEDEEW